MLNRVDHLLVRPFEAHSHAEKMEIKRLGPHQPYDIVITQHNTKVDKRHANRSFVVAWFSKVRWLTVSESKKGLYCFPCILFGDDSTWSKSGYYDLKHLSERIRRHECSAAHINNCLQLKLFGQDHVEPGGSSNAIFVGADGLGLKIENDTIIDSLLSGVLQDCDSISTLEERHREHVQRHNEDVDRKHYVLAKLIDCILFCFSSGMPLKMTNGYRGNNYAGDQVDFGKQPYTFSMVLNFTACIDHVLAVNMEGSKSFLTETVYNELLECILQVYREELTREVSKSRYVSILMEDFTQMLGQNRTAIVLRYLTENGCQLVERLWGLLDNPLDEIVFAEFITKDFGRYNFETKLVAHAHNGVFATSGAVTVTNTSIDQANVIPIIERVQKLYPHAGYVHSYAHPLTIILCNLTSAIEPIRVFFANLTSFPAFFSTTAPLKRINLLRDIGDGFRMNCNDDHLVATVYENRETLLACFAGIIEGDNWDLESVHGASVLQNLLYSARFLFFLKFFHLVMPFAEIVHQKFMIPDLTEVAAQNAVKNFTTAIEWIAINEIDNISTSASSMSASGLSDNNNEASMPWNKTIRLDVSDDWRQAAREACNMMIADVVQRFRYINYLLAFQLVDSELFGISHERFPEERLRAAEEEFSRMIAIRKLKVELQAIYSNPAFKLPMGLTGTLEMINKNDLRDDFSETCKLLEIALTCPIATADSERCFDTLQRTKSWLQMNPDNHDDVTGTSIASRRLNATTVITIQTEFMRLIPNFTEVVIDKFSAQEHRRDAFIHKNFSPLPNYRKTPLRSNFDKSCNSSRNN